MNWLRLSIIGLFMLFLVNTVLAHEGHDHNVSLEKIDKYDNIGLKKIEEYNNQQAQKFLETLTLAMAFLAGITSILSPCILPFFPAFFAITFKQKNKITLATLIFFLGFTLTFIVLGLFATLTGKILSTVFGGIYWLIPSAGIILIIFGFMILLGKGFPGLVKTKKFKRDFTGLFLTGILFGVGWTACVGPIISGVLIMTSVFQNYLTAVLLMISYSLGIFLPLFALSFFYEKTKINKLKWLNNKKIIMINDKPHHTTNANILSGSIFIFFGGIFMLYKGTSIFNDFQMFGLKNYFYTIQNYFLNNITTINWIGTIIFIFFILLIAYFSYTEIKNEV